MKFSIITVTFNCKYSIEKTIQSVLNQSYYDIEYLVCDGNSVDGTNSIIEKYASKIDVYVCEPDTGIYNAMNKAISLSTGDIVMFLNSGDVFVDNDSIKRISRAFDPDVDILVAKELIEGTVCSTYSPKFNKSIYIDAFFPHQATFSRRHLYEEDGYFDESYRICADYDWILRECSLGRKIKWVDDVVSVYDADGISSSVKCTAEQYIISKKYLSITGQTDLFPYMDKYYSDAFRKVFFRRLIKENVSNDMITDHLKRLLRGRSVSVWGFGTIGKALCSFLLDNHIDVCRIIDLNPNMLTLEYKGIRISEFDPQSNDIVIVSSEKYDKDICNNLKGLGKKSGIDYLSYFSFSSMVVINLLEDGYDDQCFKKITGLDVLRYIHDESSSAEI